MTIAYDALSGRQIWQARFDGFGTGSEQSSEDIPRAIGISPDGCMIFVAGESGFINGTQIGLSFGTIAYDASGGRRLWATRHIGPRAGQGQDEVAALGVAPDGTKVFITGLIWHSSSTPIWFVRSTTLAYDTFSGDLLWVSDHTDPDVYFNTGDALAVRPDGSTVAITGRAFTTRKTGLTIAYASDSGERLWDTPSPRYHTGDMAWSHDGSQVYVTGPTGTGAYNANTGDQIWLNCWPDDGGAGNALAVSPLLFAVYLAQEPGWAVSFLEDEDGQVLWTTKKTDSLSRQSAQALTLSRDGGSTQLAKISLISPRLLTTPARVRKPGSLCTKDRTSSCSRQ